MSLLMPEMPEQARLLVEQLLHLRGRQAERLEQVQDDTRVHRAGPRAHAEAVERGEAERAVHALARLHRAQAGAAAEVRDDHAPVGDLRRHVRAARRRCTRTTGRGSRSAARRSRGSPPAAARARPRPAGRDGSWCRSRPPAARPAAARRRPRWRPGCAAGGAAPAATSARRSSSTCGCDDARLRVLRAAVDDAVADAEHTGEPP